MTKFCTQCGAQVAETARFCKKCGNQLAPTQPAEHSAPTANYQTPTYQQPPNFPPGQANFPPGQVPYQTPYQTPVANADLKPNIAGLLCYPLSFVTGILFLVLTPYNRDRFVRFHAWQSIFFFIAMFVAHIILKIVSLLAMGDFLTDALKLIFVAGSGWSMYKAYHGEQFKLPLVGDWAEHQTSKDPV